MFPADSSPKFWKTLLSSTRSACSLRERPEKQVFVFFFLPDNREESFHQFSRFLSINQLYGLFSSPSVSSDCQPTLLASWTLAIFPISAFPDFLLRASHSPPIFLSGLSDPKNHVSFGFLYNNYTKSEKFCFLSDNNFLLLLFLRSCSVLRCCAASRYPLAICWVSRRKCSTVDSHFLILFSGYRFP